MSIEEISRINGHDMAWSRDGNPQGEPVILIHSLSTASAAWDSVTGLLAADFDVIRYDLRGHGASEAVAGDYDFDMLVADLLGLIDHLEIGKVHLVGLSIGGMIAQNFAVAHQDRLLSLSILASLPKIPTDILPMWAERKQMIRDKGIESQVQLQIERWYPETWRDTPEAKTAITQTEAMIRSASANGMIGCCSAIEGLDVLDDLPQIQTRSLIIVGDADTGTPPEQSRLIADRIPNNVLHILPGLGHQLALQAPDLIASLLRTHFTD